MNFNEFLKNVGNGLKLQRNKMGLRQSDIAELAEMDIREYQRIEAGERNLTLKTLFQVSNALKCQPKILLQTQNIVHELPIKEGIPFFENIYVAAGVFHQEVFSGPDLKWIKAPQYTNKPHHFALKISGHSMDPQIPSGSICIFKKYTGGTRQNKIMLCERLDGWEDEGLGAYVLKTYKRITDIDDHQSRENVIIHLISFNKSYPPIVLDAKSGAKLKTIAEFVQIL